MHSKPAAALSFPTRRVALVLACAVQGAAAVAQTGHEGHMIPPAAPAAPAGDAPAGQAGSQGMAMPGHDGHAMPPAAPGDASGPHAMTGHDMAGHDMGGHTMPALLGLYSMNRESSGTSWQPESSPMYATMVHSGAWSGMAQANATLAYTDQGGPRGGAKTFVPSMAMLMGSRPVGEHGRLGLRAMLSLDPLMGRRGYPNLFATGETADGVTKLVDRQHPHDFVMELAASYSHDLGGGHAAYLYAGLPGEPALGPPAFMHRISGLDNPEAPIGHHWFDSTHITWGVVTAGFSTNRWKVEASAFKGREPDEKRWDFETPRLDSWSVRAFWNPTANLSLQASTGHIESPEQLHPDEDEQRTTLSATWNRPLGPGANWATTVAWSLKDIRPGGSYNGWLAETALRWADRHTLYARAERVEEAELFGEDEPLHHDVFTMNKLSLGYQYELPVTNDLRLAVGGLASAYGYASALAPAYGRDGIKSFLVYLRASFGDRRIR